MNPIQLLELLERNVKRIISSINKKILRGTIRYGVIVDSGWAFFKKRRMARLERENIRLLGRLAGWEDVGDFLDATRKAVEENDFPAAVEGMELVRSKIISLSPGHMDLAFLAEGFIGCYMGDSPIAKKVTGYFVKKYSRMSY